MHNVWQSDVTAAYHWQHSLFYCWWTAGVSCYVKLGSSSWANSNLFHTTLQYEDGYVVEERDRCVETRCDITEVDGLWLTTPVCGQFWNTLHMHILTFLQLIYLKPFALNITFRMRVFQFKCQLWKHGRIATCKICTCACLQHFVLWPDLLYILCCMCLNIAIRQNNNPYINSSIYSLL